MDKLQFRTLIARGPGSIPRRCSEVNPRLSVTDPTLVMTGSQMAYAAMLGQPIPQPPVNYSFNSATTPEDVQEFDSMRADKFEVYAHMQKNKDAVQLEFNNAIQSSNEFKQLKDKHYE